MNRLEESVRQPNRPEKREIANEERMPYYNSLIGPRTRTKRSENSAVVQENPQQSDEHIKLLEESFPNPAAGMNVDESEHVRVKRNERLLLM